MEWVKGPDFPTGGVLVDDEGRETHVAGRVVGGTGQGRDVGAWPVEERGERPRLRLFVAASAAADEQWGEEKKGCGAPHSANLGDCAAPAAGSSNEEP